MFSIITQQIDVAAESGQGRILFGTVQECGNILKERQSFLGENYAPTGRITT